MTLYRVGRSFERTVATVSVGGRDMGASLIAGGGRGEAVAARPAQVRLVPLMDWRDRFAGDLTLATLLTPTRLYTAAEADARGIGAPSQPGIYAWYSDVVLPGVDASECHRRDDLTLLYCSISPKKPPTNGRSPSRSHIQQRLRTHFGGNAAGSTLRLTLGCLLEAEVGTTLRRVGTTGRLTFTNPGEQLLDRWLHAHARVAWATHPAPWEPEHLLLTSGLPLPFNIDGNPCAAFTAPLSALGSAAVASRRDATADRGQRRTATCARSAGMSGTMENPVCLECIGNVHLRARLAAGAVTAVCEECGESRPSIKLAVLAEQIHEAFAPHFELTPYDQNTSAAEIFTRIAGIDDDLAQRIEEHLREVHEEIASFHDCQNLYDYLTGFAPGRTPIFWQDQRWQRFCDSLRKKARHINAEALAWLDEVFADLGGHLTYDAKPIIKTVEPATPGGQFYRARIAANEPELCRILLEPVSRSGRCRPARAMAAGSTPRAFRPSTARSM
ncbi:hypothetical protein NZL82_18085 [Sphingomonas sanguinis]|nr:hypothetical protein [Sphingomonas sp. LC-1]